MDDWLYYRIYAKEVENWYPKLLIEIVRPLIAQNEKLIKSFFFFHYHHPYGMKPYDAVEASEPKFEVGTDVRFIRLRILAEQTDITTLEDHFRTMTQNSSAFLEWEKCFYNEKADLGNRFGEARIDLVRNYLEYASRLTLSLLDDPKDNTYLNKVMGLIHLPCNMLELSISIRWGNSTLFNI